MQELHNRLVCRLSYGGTVTKQFTKFNDLQHVGHISLSAVHLFLHMVTGTLIKRHSKISHS